MEPSLIGKKAFVENIVIIYVIPEPRQQCVLVPKSTWYVVQLMNGFIKQHQLNWNHVAGQSHSDGGNTNGVWVPAINGHIPNNAFPGGDNDGEPIFVARGRVGGSLAAGSLLASHKCCYVAWGGNSHALSEYEVLCNFTGSWIEWSGTEMPRSAYVAGVSEVNQELMYVGRAVIDGILKVGKIHPSHGVTYIGQNGREIAFSNYEILVTNPRDAEMRPGASSKIETPDKLEYQFIPNNTGFVQFRVRADHDAHVALTVSAAECDPMYEVFFGSWNNSKSIIRKNRTKPDVAEANTPAVLNPGEFRGFWIRWNNGTITAGTEGNYQPILTYTDSEIVPIEYVGFCTGWGATGSWIVQPAGPPSAAPSAPMPYTGGPGAFGPVCWVEATSGQVPPNAFVGGEDNGEPMYVIRGKFNDGLIPGKLLSSHGCSYVPWGGEENGLNTYDVLCDFNGDWVDCSGGNIPPNSLSAGESEDGEPLYVGRVLHEGSMTVGKVQQSHGVCYIPYGGKELGFPEYQILVTRN
ncbi:hypothetical protein MML48_1g15758 [Holotrichia oblita]|uniref:Uncharacterized protein n=1 Tax=Holotrichia oblita TaxID=644536 RepID=A0ACB9TW69_HOLOL|nr:hypothetical protein MML48_1g15758 [Holotrichia oblita]